MTTRLRSSLISAVLWLVVAAGCADVAGTIPDAGQPDTGYAPPPSWRVLESTAREDLFDLYGTRISDVWAVGARGVILHFDGVSWDQHHTPAKTDLRAIWTPRDGGLAWAVGDQGTVVRYDGEHWFIHEVDNNSADLKAIWGSGPKDVWVVGSHGTVMRFDGENWLVDRAPTGLTLHSVWGFSSRDLYVAGVGDVFHYDGKRWERVLSSGVTTFYAIWGSAPDNVWAMGDRGVAYRYDGKRWHTVQINLPVADDPTERQRAHGTRAIWGSAPDDVWTIGYPPTQQANGRGQPAVLHYNGEGWSVRKRLEPDQRLYDLWTSGPNDVWTIGNDGLLLRFYEPPAP